MRRIIDQVWGFAKGAFAWSAVSLMLIGAWTVYQEGSRLFVSGPMLQERPSTVVIAPNWTPEGAVKMAKKR